VPTALAERGSCTDPLTPMDGEEEHRRHVDTLDGAPEREIREQLAGYSNKRPIFEGSHFHGVDGGDTERRRLLVSVVKFVEVLVQRGQMVDPVRPIRQIVLKTKKMCEEKNFV